MTTSTSSAESQSSVTPTRHASPPQVPLSSTPSPSPSDLPPAADSHPTADSPPASPEGIRPPPLPRQAKPTPRTSVQDAVIPPPPPPRVTPAPVRPISERPSSGRPSSRSPNSGRPGADRETPASAKPSGRIIPSGSGIGTATGVRWSGEVDRLGEAPESNRSAEDAEDQIVLLRRSIWEMAPSWLISTIVHLILFIILALITFPKGDGLGQLFLELAKDGTDQNIELSDFAIQPIEAVVDEESLDFETVESVEISDIDVPLEKLVPEVVPDLTREVSADAAIGDGGEVSPPVQPMFGGRSGELKKALLAKFGGTPETQEAVELGLQWLKKNQLKDGGWSLQKPFSEGAFRDCRTGATAMAILAFAGDGNTHLSGPYRKEVERGVRYLVRKQDRNGLMAHDGYHHGRTYAQAQATIALCELYAMTGDSWIRPYAQNAVDFAVRNQSREGGWRYEFPSRDADLSVTGWYVMALQSARSTDLEVPAATMQTADYYLDSVQHADGAGYSYQPTRGPSPAMCAEGLLCRFYLGWPRDRPAAAEGVEALLKQYPFDMDETWDVYYWYYATQVLHHYGGSAWRIWNDKMRDQLPAAQIKRGPEAGSWPSKRDDRGLSWGRLYQTCMSIYCLEVYYRHLPIYEIPETP